MKRAIFMALVSLILLRVMPFNGVSVVQSAETKKMDISIACAETTQALVDAVVPVMAEKGYKVTYQIFNNNVNTLVAVNDGSMEALMLVHKPFMQIFNHRNNADLVMVEPHMFAVGMGLFSERYTSIEDLPENASIAIMNDSMNMDRGLRIMADANILSIDPSKKTVSLIDIVENPKNFKFVEMDQTQTVRSLQDMDAAIAFFSHMKNADKDFNNYLIRDQRPDQYPQGVIVKAENAKAQWAHDLVQAFRSKEIRDIAYKYYGGLYEYFD
ncbi:MetQ/NlpA family ABC transporter substrate-binding protein [Desulfofustis glycolicus]|uniref:D-methionine transport system substrate-binding protein n=1 Tax=Desulfofustis glycolicus DSM 9705 TaxID=1121409 RepID=A0A1M5YQN1_9BACT|nr:MetQ/NlpA family ABC transporter substrate-binding protein [Desulfofustis glycolicus]MCB2215833.1 hypothetical protein [Desulfobulbaceae bacterium]SHI14376.1 D-methionine transport system substrate-binding protein [Desulfofustis glycolicus DSM 9705]